MKRRTLRLCSLRAGTRGNTARTAWRPLVLRWRRRLSRAPVAARPPGAVAPIVQALHQHLHRHFGGASMSRHSAMVERHTAAARELRSIESHIERVALYRSTFERHFGERWRSAKARDARARYDIHAAATVSGHRRGADMRSARIASLPRRSSFALPANGPLPQPVRFRDAARSTPRVTERARAPMPSLRSGGEMRFAASPRKPSVAEMRAHPVFPVDLVWRRAEGSASDAPVRPSPGAMPATVAQVSSSAAPEAREPSRQAATVASAPARLEPAVLERLAEDVIRRVERRARIERERRGL